MTFEATLIRFGPESDESIARKHMEAVNALVKKIQCSKKVTEAEQRELMEHYLAVFWVFEELRPEMSAEIHRIGKDLEQTFQCQFLFDEKCGKYFSSCPAYLLHYDFGFSMRGAEKYKCSICGLPITECDHITGEFYDGVICHKSGSSCNICGEEHCEHVEGCRYNHVMAVKIVYDANIETFDMVADPEMKFARVCKVYLEKEDILHYLDEQDHKIFQYGKSPLYCHHCSLCDGYVPGKFADLFDRRRRETASK